MEETIPDWLIERSFVFKTLVIIAGAITLLLSSYIRPSYPVLWMPVFLFGALIEWLIVATVYIEIGEVESKILDAQDTIVATRNEMVDVAELATEAKREISDIQQEINGTQTEIEQTMMELQETKNDTFSTMSDSHRGGSRSIEHRLQNLEESVSKDRYEKGLEQRIDEVERKLDKFSRQGPF
jgi:hypothetical protein